MRIHAFAPNAPGAPSSPAGPARPPVPEAGPVDSVEAPGGRPADAAPACWKVAGSVGAMAGALGGRALAVAGTAALGAAAALAALPGGALLAAIAGGAAGLYAGYRMEKALKAGRVAGGMVGGALGAAVGRLADALGRRPQGVLGTECRGFSLAKLPGRLANPDYTSHPTMKPPDYAEGIARVRPGDVLITNDDRDFKLEILQKLLGYSGDWTHAALADENHGAMDILVTENHPTRWPLEFLFEDNCHVTVLRPRYSAPDSATKVLDAVRARFGNTTYDSKFDLGTDDAMYCQELLYKGFRQGDPGIEIGTRRVLGRDFVGSDDFLASKDMEVVWSSGSDFWLNWLSKFN